MLVTLRARAIKRDRDDVGVALLQLLAQRMKNQLVAEIVRADPPGDDHGSHFQIIAC
jgi:hypothetical protein